MSYSTDTTILDIDAREARARQAAGAILIDVREPYEWAGFHAPGAVNIPLGQLALRQADIPRDRDLLVVCASGSRSQLATGMLRRTGYERAFNVLGGMFAWAEQGLPVEDARAEAEAHEPAVDVRTIRTPGLGDSTYLLNYRGVGIVVDPQRDVERFLEAADEAGATVRYVLETHMHNDYVSGGRELARQAGAELILPAGAGVAFDHTPAFHLEDFEDPSGLVIKPVHTPGHTPEHLSYLVLLEGEPVALFSGGSLLVGSAGRPDLLGTQRARQLAIAQYHSVRRLATLPDEVGLFPTHGQGSFCVSSGADKSTSTIGFERQTNPVFSYQDAATYAEALLPTLQPYPRYYAFMGPINTLGPTPLPQPEVPALTPAELKALGAEVYVVDARPRASFATAHVPGSLGVELADDFATWVGWLVPFNAPIALILDPDQDLTEAVVQLGRIGYDDVRGVLRGIDTWRAAGEPVAGFTSADADGFATAIRDGLARQILDVRSPGEYEAGSLPGATHAYVPNLVDGAPALTPDEPVWVFCASGFRASIAASLLLRHGFQPIVLQSGGAADVDRLLGLVQVA